MLTSLGTGRSERLVISLKWEKVYVSALAPPV
jgi:hypothetical protein